ncbi:MAG: hypothetical protein WCO56_29665, partial [Verrucomicrobiota bacterium]
PKSNYSPLGGNHPQPDSATMSPMNDMNMNRYSRPEFRTPNWRQPFAWIGVIRGLRSSVLAPSGHNVFANKFFCHVRLSIRGQRIVMKNQIHHNFITICVKNFVSSQKHNN